MRVFGFLCSLFFTSIAAAQGDLPPSLTSSAPQGEFTHMPPKVSEINASLFQYLYDLGWEFYAFVRDGVVSLGDFVETGEWLVGVLAQPTVREQVYEFLTEFGISILVALVLERFLTWLLFPWARRFCDRLKWPHFWRDIAKVFVCLIPVIVFGVSFYATFRLLEPIGMIYLHIATIFINGVTFIWGILRTSGVLLVPKDGDSHLPFSKESLQRAHRWFKYMAIVVLSGYFIVQVGNIIDLPIAGHRLVIQITSLIILVMALSLVIGFDGEYRSWLSKRRAVPGIHSWEKRLLGFMYFAPFLFVYLLLLGYITWVMPLNEVLLWGWKLFGSIALLPLFFYGQHLISLFRDFCVTSYILQIAPKVAKEAQFYKVQIDFILSSILSLILFLFAVWMWGGNPFYFFTSSVGQWMTEKVLSVIVIVAVALFLLRAGNGILAHYLDPTGIRGLPADQRARMRTIYSISQSILKVIIWIPALLLVLTELDIDVFPALATIGVLGLGISFGVRSVVEDFITGLFMLVEDTFAVGDAINVNGQVGQVESLTVRVLRLRAMDGTLHSIAYGKINNIFNYSRKYSVAILMIKVGREADTKIVDKLIAEVDTTLRKKNEDVKEYVMEPILIDGVTEVTDSSKTIRLRVRTKPKMHWKIKRVYEQAISDALDKKGVSKPIPREYIFNQSVPTRSQVKP